MNKVRQNSEPGVITARWTASSLLLTLLGVTLMGMGLYFAALA